MLDTIYGFTRSDAVGIIRKLDDRLRGFGKVFIAGKRAIAHKLATVPFQIGPVMEPALHGLFAAHSGGVADLDTLPTFIVPYRCFDVNIFAI